LLVGQELVQGWQVFPLFVAIHNKIDFVPSTSICQGFSRLPEAQYVPLAGIKLAQ
jgi:hypothetical protein